QWCWAAVSASVDRYFSPKSHWTQCQIAKAVAELGKLQDVPPNTNCCADGEACNVPASLSDALTVVGRFKAAVPRPLEFDEIKSELDSLGPVGAKVDWAAGGAHFVLIVGYGTAQSDQNVVTIADPWFGVHTIYYEDFLTAYQFWTEGGGQWTASYYLEE